MLNFAFTGVERPHVLSLEVFSRLQMASSEDSAIMQAKKTLKNQTYRDIENALLNMDGEEAEIEGALISNLVKIIKVELAFYRMPLEEAIKPISNDHQGLINSLRVGATVTADIIHQGIGG